MLPDGPGSKHLMDEMQYRFNREQSQSRTKPFLFGPKPKQMEAMPPARRRCVYCMLDILDLAELPSSSWNETSGGASHSGGAHGGAKSNGPGSGGPNNGGAATLNGQFDINAGLADPNDESDESQRPCLLLGQIVACTKSRTTAKEAEESSHSARSLTYIIFLHHFLLSFFDVPHIGPHLNLHFDTPFPTQICIRDPIFGPLFWELIPM